MMIMERDGSIEQYTAPSAVETLDGALERVFVQSEALGHELAAEVRARVDARFASLNARLAPLTSSSGLALATS